LNPPISTAGAWNVPWYLFADKYEKMLIANGKIEMTGDVAIIRPEESLPEVEQIRIAIRRLEGLVEANKTELAPLLDDVVSLKNGADRVDEKLHKLIDIGKIVVVCLVVVAVFVVVGVVTMVVK
jgi:ubiquinone biosynthesis protein UbiJ